MHFEFLYPHILWLLLLLPLIAFFKGRRGSDAAIVFSDVKIAEEVSKKNRVRTGWLLMCLRLLILGSLIVTLARPRVGEGEVKASGIDIVLAVDVSSSMLALDFKEDNRTVTRLDIVKKVIEDFIKKRPNDRIGLVAFAGNPYLVSPLTLNHNWIEQNMDRLRVGLADDGTAIGSAIAMSVNRFRNIHSKSKIVILLTDGINNAGKVTPLAASEAAAAMGVRVYTIAAGKGGNAPVMQVDKQGNPIVDAMGRNYVAYMTVPVDTKMLEKVAELTQAKFYWAHNTSELRKIYDQIDELEKTEIVLKTYAYYKELFIWPLLLAGVLLLLEQLLSNTRLRRLP